jgi:hypothetical protein
MDQEWPRLERDRFPLITEAALRNRRPVGLQRPALAPAR